MWLSHSLLSQVRWAKTWSLNLLRSLWLYGWTNSQDILQELSLQSTGLSPESHLEALTAPPKQPFSLLKPSLFTWKTLLRLMAMASLYYVWTISRCRLSSSTLLTERSSSLTSISSGRTIPICLIRAKILMHHLRWRISYLMLERIRISRSIMLSPLATTISLLSHRVIET